MPESPDDRLPARAHPEQFDLRAQLHALLTHHQLATQQYSLRLALDEQLPHAVRGNARAMQQVLTRLLEYALGSASTGQITLTVDAMGFGFDTRLPGADDAQNERLVRFAMADSSAGMNHESVQRLQSWFEDRTELGHSVGGIATALIDLKQLLVEMDGHISLSSAAGSGTCVTVIVPLWPVSPLPAASASTVAERSGQILVVDDNPVNLQVCCAMLQQLGLACCIATDGAHALQVVADGGIDLVLMDIHMPEMDGTTATRILRNREQAAGCHPVPVLALSASVDEADHRNSLAAGMNAFIAKPITLSSLRAALERWLPAVSLPPLPACQPAVTSDTDRDGDAPAEHLDIRQFAEVQELAGDRFVEMLIRYLQDTRQQAGVLQQAITTANAQTMAQAAHRIRGASASLGFVQLAILCAQTESRARANRLDGMAEQMALVEQELRAVSTTLQPYLASQLRSI